MYKMFSEENLKSRYILFGIYHLDYEDVLLRMKKFPSVRIANCNQLEAYKWCQDVCGDNWVWSSPLFTEFTLIYFMHNEDATAFRLTFETA